MNGSGFPDVMVIFFVLAIVASIVGFSWRVGTARRIAREAGLNPDDAATTAVLGGRDGLAATYLAANLRPQPVDDYVPSGHLDPPSSRQHTTEPPQHPTAPPQRTIESRLGELKHLHEQGLITDGDYDRRRAEILHDV
ncbi:MAG: DUF1328 domain-containing protein [Frankiaceae bacterium]|nr:DUF1328 domain-containing protein [Frankiaceae bacterium]MBV9369824.1 DUF1328 domain-containing protein [Frankiales bacterium]